MPDSFKVKVNMPTREGMPRRQPFKRRTTLEEVVLWIEAQDYDDFDKTELIKMLKKYPYNLYENFRQNINVHLQRINAKKRHVQVQEERKEKNEAKERVEEGDSITEKRVADFNEGSEL